MLITALAAVIVTVALAGCDLPGQPDRADRPELPSADLSFASLYGQNCAGCHGNDGRMGPAPPLNDRMFLARAPVEELSRVIAAGRAGTPMPPFAASHGGALTEQQVTTLAAGLRKQWLRGDDESTMPSPALPPAPGDAARGAKIFSRACADCHAAESPSALDNAAFLALISNQALRRLIITGRADLGMPDYAEATGRPDDYQPLTSDEINDLVALLASWRGTPSAAPPETTP